MAQTSQIEGVTIYDDEELLHHEKGFSGNSGGSGFLKPINLILAFFTFGLWWVFLYFKDSGAVEYVITNERIITKKGTVSTSTEQVSFEEIVGDIRTEQNIIQSIFDIGDIEFAIKKSRETAATTGEIGDRERSQRAMDIDRQKVVLSGIKNHNKVADSIRRIHRQS